MGVFLRVNTSWKNTVFHTAFRLATPCCRPWDCDALVACMAPCRCHGITGTVTIWGWCLALFLLLKRPHVKLVHDAITCFYITGRVVNWRGLYADTSASDVQALVLAVLIRAYMSQGEHLVFSSRVLKILRTRNWEDGEKRVTFIVTSCTVSLKILS